MEDQLKIGAILSYSSMIIGYIISIIYTPYMLRKLGASEFGLYTLVVSTVSYLSLLSFGFEASYLRNYSIYKSKQEEEKINQLNGMFLIVFLGLAFLSLIIGYYLSTKVDLLFGDKLTIKELEIARILIYILTLNIALTFPKSVFNNYIQAKEKFIFAKLLQMLNTIVTPLLTVLVLFIGFKSKGIVLITLIMQITTFILSIIYCKKILKMKINYNYFNTELMKDILIFSSFIFLNMIIDQINWSVDKFLLGRYWGTSSVAIYGIAALLNTYFIVISTTISSVFVPRINKIVAQGERNKELTKLFTRIGRIQFMMLMLILTGLYIFGESFIKMWAGETYRNAYYILIILTTSVTIPLIQNIGIEIQKAKNKHQFRSLVYLFIAVLNIAVSIPLIKLYAGIGAAIGTAGALVVGNCIIMNIYYHKKIGLDMIYFWKQIGLILPSLLVPIILGIFINLKIDLDNILNFFISGLLYVVVYSVSLFFISMNDSEKQLIINPIESILKKLKLRRESNDSNNKKRNV